LRSDGAQSYFNSIKPKHISNGMMFYQGHGVSQDYVEAEKWYRLAADQGLPKAQYNLGHMRIDDQGPTQDRKQALKWFRLAADQGHLDAKIAIQQIRNELKTAKRNFTVLSRDT
jgi:TPR repeat protein